MAYLSDAMRHRPTVERRPAILLIEDDRDTREMYKTYLLSQGLKVVAARNGMEGFTRACETEPDIIVTDVMLPNIDGWELVERLRADSRTSRIPVVVVTGCTGPVFEDRARRLGCAKFLVKPCLPDTLASEIRRLLPPSRSASDSFKQV